VRGLDFGANGSRSRWLAAVPVAIALVGAVLLLPRSATPEIVPLPRIDTAAFRARVEEDVLRAERARREGLPSDVREFGTLIREWNHSEAAGDDATRVARARGALDAALPAIVTKDVERLRMLRAVELETFLDEVRAFERTGKVSEELVAVGGPFIERMRAVGWCRGQRVLLTENERRVAYKLAWNGVAGVERRADFALSLDETRALYGLYLRLPHAPETQIRGFEAARRGARDVAACEALGAGEKLAAEGWRLERIGRLAALDPTYPATFARGIAQFRMGRFAAAADAFEAYARDHAEGPHALESRNFLSASLAAARENAQ
jgi:hypothetical protein